MADYLDPSPRSSKRRRTTYKTTRSILGLAEDAELPSTTVMTGLVDQPVQTSDQQNDSIDSAYGSKEDSLLEDVNPQITNTEETTRSARSSARKKQEKGKDTPERGATGPTKRHRGNVQNNEKVTDQTPTKTTRNTTPIAVESGDEMTEDTIAVQPRSSTRERKRPRRFSISPEKPRSRKQLLQEDPSQEQHGLKSKRSPEKTTAVVAAAVESPLKGILTPSRREKRSGPRKSVVFDQDEEDIGEQFGFKDIGDIADRSEKHVQSKSPSKKHSRRTPRSTDATRESPAVENSILATESVLEPQDEEIFDEVLVESLQARPLETEEDDLAATHVNIEDEPSVLAAKAAILSRLVATGVPGISPHLQTQYDTLHTLLHATVTSGESNSLLLLGGRGTGKSHLLEAALSDLRTKYTEEFYNVHLSGFFQTDDKLALREIWRQLGREMQVDEMESGELGGSYADTMTSLLSLLSHPDEFADPVVNGDGDAMHVDNAVTRTSKSIVFVLDEFDLFTTHPRQTLLYNLFDIAQSKKAPIAVIGCSTRMDVVECLEKRVKSRFSHRWLHIPSIKSLSSFQDAVSSVLCFEENSIAATKSSKKDIDTRKQWNETIQSNFLPQSDTQDLIQRVYHTTRSLPDLFAALYLPIATLQLPSQNNITAAAPSILHLHPTASDLPTQLSLLTSLPTLHLSLLTAATRLDTIHNLTTVNFNLVYAHYTELIARSKLQLTASGAVAVGASLRQWSRDSARSAWEDLAAWEFIVPAVGTVKDGVASADGAGEAASVRMWRADVTLAEVAWGIREKWREGGGVRDVLVKWCREI